MWSLAALVIGFCIDLLVGDPHGFPHPVVLIGKCISVLERVLRCVCPKTPAGERAAGAILWGAVVIISTAVPALLLWLCGLVSPWLRLALESVMCWQILAVKSLRDETMKVYDALESGDLAASRRAVSMIVGRDTDRLDDAAVTRAAVETVAENTSDGVVAPLLFLAIGGAPLGFFYKAVNTMDSMLGYVEVPYKNIGLVPAKADAPPAAGAPPASPQGGDEDAEPPASHAELEGFFAQLGETLDAIDFHKGRTPESALRKLRRIFLRADMNAREVRLMRGVLADAQRMARLAGEG